MQIIQDLKTTRDQTLRYFDLPESDLGKRYASGKWTVKQLLHHLADAETVLYDRLRRGITKPGQVVWGFDQDAWCTGLDYQHQDLKLNQPIYTAVRAAVIDLAERFYASNGANPYVHNETGLRTVKDEFDKVAWHNLHHLEQIARALA